MTEEHVPSIVNQTVRFRDGFPLRLPSTHKYTRYDSTPGGKREIRRTMLELLNQLNGSDTRGYVKVIMATNHIDSLDPAPIRPGRIDRKLEFPLPDVKNKRHIFKLHTSRMSLSEDVDLEEFIMTKDDSGGRHESCMCGSWPRSSGTPNAGD